jgi:tetratricopeptide (TPR) repeat protein
MATNPIPPQAQQLFLDGNTAAKAEDWPTAIARFTAALAIYPDDSDCLNALAIALKASGKTAAAIACWQRAVALAPTNGRRFANLGLTLYLADRYDEAEVALTEAYRLAPDYPQASHFLGLLYCDLGRYEESVEAFERALKLWPRNSVIRWDLVLCRLWSGDLAGAWADYGSLYEHRHPHIMKIKLPMWNGEPLEGKTLWVHPDQGLGDTIMMARYVPMLAAQGAKLIVDVPPHLLRLFTRLDGVAELRQQGNAEPEADYHCPFMALAGRVGTTIETIPSQIPYLTVPDEIKTNLPGGQGKLKVGLVWGGSKTNPRRSILFEDIVSIMGEVGAAFYSLQLGPQAADIAEHGAGPLVVDLSPALRDFADTGLVMRDLDLIITIDTAAAHLAGAMGRPTFLMLPYLADWRWGHAKTTSPWYPTMRLFRQTQRNDWREALLQLRQALAEKVAAFNAGP